jgi:hypothetical protein
VEAPAFGHNGDVGMNASWRGRSEHPHADQSSFILERTPGALQKGCRTTGFAESLKKGSRRVRVDWLDPSTGHCGQVGRFRVDVK